MLHSKHLYVLAFVK